MQYAFKTDTGRVRQHNEDSGGVFTKGEHFLALIADGMGGHKAGDVASSKTIQSFEEAWNASSEEISETPVKAEEWLLETVTQTNLDLHQYANKNIDCSGMGTTLVGALCTPSYLTILHIGDSRVYYFSEKKLIQKTEDHTLVNELVRSGQLSETEAENHPRKNVILRALGTDDHIDVDIQTISWGEGDIVLLCSDGLSNKVTRETMENILNDDNLSLEDKADRLVNLANEAGGEDNITIGLVHYTPQTPEKGVS
ncbi:Stp1/IreP family PP2C-type Ser/Thr phosphatase [Fictibacillus sp. WQ 8-8]|uniref:Stp1/IreP family PP2C-type Ser/Thr phosphatase n=1 Tax=unclassified Fictibacillus TaxID=2644029 RepID=UPI0006A774D5|nr:MULTISPECIES: Stp1/IreP family PP2C-type Ser/Thr phosphatase [unclassified Fictibacillus]MCQ6265744.1 Stp1/IreP family PP2C-type Ser/Thr phosphatase [Fictibacillus sp. WQ 8-8]MED2973374.1 Stp1/IreP family PP2C-type Ser/Thr phosphatase [Fictibacillus sp. B-59209]UZJ77210.1 Stp1/IreP family PP2C-type Ser/Thr phosphatase [Fictibacillus sp. KU28468]SFD86580.1 protein phosphatase [Bacillus sp. OV194]